MQYNTIGIVLVCNMSHKNESRGAKLNWTDGHILD